MKKNIFYLSLALCGIIFATSSHANDISPKNIDTVTIKVAENNGVWEGTKEVAKDTWEGTKNVTSDVWDGAKNVTSDVWDGTKKVGSDIKDGISGDKKEHQIKDNNDKDDMHK